MYSMSHLSLEFAETPAITSKQWSSSIISYLNITDDAILPIRFRAQRGGFSAIFVFEKS